MTPYMRVIICCDKSRGVIFQEPCRNITGQTYNYKPSTTCQWSFPSAVRPNSKHGVGHRSRFFISGALFQSP